MSNSTNKIIEATKTHMPLVRELFREYQAWLDNDICFKDFEAELAGLPGRYAPPGGAIYLAVSDTANQNKLSAADLIGIVAVRPLGASTGEEAELKRLYVKSENRGLGVGKALFQHVMAATEAMGYDSMVLETLPVMQAAQALYQQYDFEPCTAYFENADPSVQFYRYHFQ